MDFTSKLSLYDILTQLISGFLILALFIPIPESNIKCMCMEDSTETYHWIFVIIFSYLIGIIYHRLLEWIRSKGFEKYLLFLLPISLLIAICQKDVECKECLVNLVSIEIVVLLIFCLLFIFKKDKIETIFCRNYEDAINEARKDVFGKVDSTKIKYGKRDYYTAYYSIMKEPAYNTITLLEAQEAFLRNMTWIVIFYISFNNCILSIFGDYKCIIITILFAFILFARYHTQIKVYKSVFDADLYISNMK